MNKINVKVILIFSIAMFCGALEAHAIGSFGLFQDTEIYYQIYRNVQEDGIFSAIVTFFINTGKFEPLIFFVFWGFGFGSGYVLNEKSFLFVFLFGVNLLLACVWIKVQTIERIKYKHVLMLMIILLGYLIFSKALYFWRSILALCFFVMYVYESRRVKYFYLLVAVLSHSTFIVFYLLFIAVSCLIKNNKYVFIKCLSISMAIALFLVVAPEVISFMVSGGNVDVLVSEGDAHSVVVLSTVLFSLLILYLIRKEMSSSVRHRDFYFFLVVLGVSAGLMFNSYHMMNRIFLPLSIMVGFLTVMSVRPSLELTCARVLMFLSVFPTIRLIFNLYTGQFEFS